MKTDKEKNKKPYELDRKKKKQKEEKKPRRNRFSNPKSLKKRKIRK